MKIYEDAKIQRQVGERVQLENTDYTGKIHDVITEPNGELVDGAFVPTYTYQVIWDQEPEMVDLEDYNAWELIPVTEVAV